MKKTILALILLAVAGAAVAADNTTRIGYVDLRKLMLESKVGKQNKAELEKFVKQKQDQLSREEEKLKTLQQDFEKNQLVLSEQQKKDKQKEFQEKVQAFQKLQGDAQQELRKRDAEFSQKALEEIRKIVADLAKERKLMLVFEQTSQPIYAEPGPDLTAEVLKRLDAKAGK